MDYVVGSVAALISGNVTPNRPKILRRALTPTKHQPSPNVTPKSEFVEDRSIFLSPTQQKKKAVVKKSPKRIFQDPNLDATEDSEENSALASPKAEKVKKQLEEKLDADDMGKKRSSLSKSPSNKLDKSPDEVSLKKKLKVVENSQVNNSTPKKNKRGNSKSNITEVSANDTTKSGSAEVFNITEGIVKSPKKKQKKTIGEIQTEDIEAADTPSPTQETSHSKNSTSGTTTQPNNQESKKKKKRIKKNKKSQNIETETPVDNKENTQTVTEPQKQKKKNRKNKPKHEQQKSIVNETPQENEKMDTEDQSDSEEVESKNIPNPNAITEKESDSEHDSDDDIESENEQENEKILTDQNKPEESSDEEEPESSNKKKQSNQNEKEVVTEEEIKRTLFIGNVLFSSKCKKEIKKIFSKYGQIVTIRIRTIPVKDARVTPKLAVIKNELHPERTTVNVYVKYADPDSVNKALSENNTVLNGHHLRVSRSDSSGAEHDPRCAVFVGNLPFAVEDDTLRAKFEGCGEISSVRIIRDKKTNAGKGFGYVNFASKDGVELALALSEEDLTIKNRILRVKRCTQQKPGGKQGGGGNRGNMGQRGGYRGNQGQRGGYGGNQGQRGVYGGNQGQRGGYGGNQGQRGGYGGNQGQRGGYRGNQGRGGGNRSNQGRGGGYRSDQEQGGGYRGDQTQAGKWGGQGQRGNWGGQGRGGGNQGDQDQGGKWGNQGQGKEDGAARRLMNKRKQQDGGGEGPPNKKEKNVDQPTKEKKPRKEFVGMTAEKKKKHKIDKGQKKKKALSEILTKKS